MTHFIYRAKHAASGDSYIGQTRPSVVQRWRVHVSTAKGAPWRRSPVLEAIRRHGGSAFVLEVLAIVEGQEAADLEEARLIWEHRPTLNVQAGGVKTRAY